MKNRYICLLTLLLAVQPCFSQPQPQSDVAVGHLRCEYRKDPLGIDRSNPLLSWWLESDRRSVKQTAYQILAASTPSLLASGQGDLWDSGRVASENTLQIPYAGKPLATAQQVFWKILAWDNEGKQTSWSQPASWVMGVLTEKDWEGAQWISGPIRKDWDFPKPAKALTGAPSPTPTPTPEPKDQLPDSILLRKNFAAAKKVRRAILFACGLGQNEMFLNGKPVTETFLNPGWTAYAKTCLYNSYDVTGLVVPGDNCLAALLGNSFFNSHEVPPDRYKKDCLIPHFEAPRLLARLVMEYEDGSRANIVTDSTWAAAPGPITLSHIYAGEDYDARLLPVNWDQPSFAASNWSQATVVEGPGGKLKGTSESAPPIRFFETFSSVSSKQNAPGVTTYDFGQNAAVVLKMTVRGSSGSIVRVEPAEIVTPQGKINTHAIRRNGRAYWEYTLKGTGDETYQGKFFYQGARYFQVELLPAKGDTQLPELLKIEARVIQADAPATGSFKCSNDLFNRIWTLIRWAQRSNMVSVMTDCPTREKTGWLEEDHLNGPALHYNWNMVEVLGKVMNDMSDAQGPNGRVPTTAPTYCNFEKFFGGVYADSPEWGSSSVVVPWQMYQIYGDINFLKDHYAMMKGYTDYLQGRATNNILSYGLGDWYDIGPGHPGQSQLTQREVTATGYLYEDTKIVAEAARLLGNQTDAAAYAAKAEEIRKKFNQTLFNQEKGVYGTAAKYPVGSQCANALPLVFGIVDSSNIPSVTEALIADIQQKGNTGGDVGYGYVLRAVADAGHSEVIYAMNNQSEKPGYGMMLKKGATALTEPWSGSGDSQNHFMLGQLNEWLFHDLAGIQNDPQAPGFKQIIIKPAIVGDLTWVNCSYESVYGPIVSNWSLDGSKLNLKVTIPPNTTAKILVPTSSPDQVQESGTQVSKVKGINILRSEPGILTLEVGSGNYQFTASFVKF